MSVLPEPATSGRPAPTARPRCTVCAARMKAGQDRCRPCPEQLPLFSATVDRRRREWRS